MPQLSSFLVLKDRYQALQYLAPEVRKQLAFESGTLSTETISSAAGHFGTIARLLLDEDGGCWLIVGGIEARIAIWLYTVT